MKTVNERIQWVCEGEQAFRPSDWAVRLAGIDAAFGPDQRLRYSRYLKPVYRDGKRCVCMDKDTASERPALYQMVLQFARQHGLSQLAGSPDFEQTAVTQSA
ncbi:MAG: DUF3579 domain-containing protein [Thiohalomonadaceae bacterium]